MYSTPNRWIFTYLLAAVLTLGVACSDDNDGLDDAPDPTTSCADACEREAECEGEELSPDEIEECANDCEGVVDAMRQGQGEDCVAAQSLMWQCIFNLPCESLEDQTIIDQECASDAERVNELCQVPGA